jgi:segregation and condensation protein B
MDIEEKEPRQPAGEATDAASEQVDQPAESEQPETAPVEIGAEAQPDDPEAPPQPAEEPVVEQLLEDGERSYTAEELMSGQEQDQTSNETEEERIMATLEAIVYITDEPLSLDQIVNAIQQPKELVKRLLDRIADEYSKPYHGLTIKEVAGGYKMATKAEHHEAVRQFVKNLNPPLKLSLAALETLAVIAYKQPMTAPEIMEIRGVQGAGVLKTLLDRKLITTAGRKNVVGKPILYKTTKEFLVQFGLKDLTELPSLKEFEELRRLAFSDEPEPAPLLEHEPAEAESVAEAGAASEGESESNEPETPESPVQPQ